MADTVTEVTSQGWLSRIGGAIKGIFVGIIMVIVAIVVLFWNEGRAVKTAKSLDEGANAVISVAAEEVVPANEGNLVHMTAEAVTSDILTDPQFGISATAIKLERVVEMYQWEEEKRTETRKKVGGGTEETTTYTYSKDWSDEVISSSDFHTSTGHQNPGSMRYEGMERVASSVKLGAFNLSSNLIGMINEYEPVPVTDQELNRLSGSLRGQLKLFGNGLYYGNDPSNPAVGDLKITFRVVKPQTISVIAQQQNSTFIPYQTEAGNALEMLDIGTKSAEQMFADAHAANTLMTWILRLVGFVVMFVGFALIFKPLSVVADVIPFIGSIVGMGTGLLSFILAAPLSLIIIAVAWIFFRPLLGIGLLILALIIIVGGGIVGWKVIAKKKAAAAVAA